jgi:hypothetical protein
VHCSVYRVCPARRINTLRQDPCTFPPRYTRNSISPTLPNGASHPIHAITNHIGLGIHATALQTNSTLLRRKYRDARVSSRVGHFSPLAKMIRLAIHPARSSRSQPVGAKHHTLNNPSHRSRALGRVRAIRLSITWVQGRGSLETLYKARASVLRWCGNAT